jgi:hypothetical protein
VRARTVSKITPPAVRRNPFRVVALNGHATDIPQYFISQIFDLAHIVPPRKSLRAPARVLRIKYAAGECSDCSCKHCAAGVTQYFAGSRSQAMFKHTQMLARQRLAELTGGAGNEARQVG